MTDEPGPEEHNHWLARPHVQLRVTGYAELPDDVQLAIQSLLRSLDYEPLTLDTSCGNQCGVNDCNRHSGDCNYNTGTCMTDFPGCHTFM